MTVIIRLHSVMDALSSRALGGMASLLLIVMPVVGTPLLCYLHSPEPHALSPSNPVDHQGSGYHYQYKSQPLADPSAPPCLEHNLLPAFPLGPVPNNISGIDREILAAFMKVALTPPQVVAYLPLAAIRFPSEAFVIPPGKPPPVTA